MCMAEELVGFDGKTEAVVRFRLAASVARLPGLKDVFGTSGKSWEVPESHKRQQWLKPILGLGLGRQRYLCFSNYLDTGLLLKLIRACRFADTDFDIAMLPLLIVGVL